MKKLCVLHSNVFFLFEIPYSNGFNIVPLRIRITYALFNTFIRCRTIWIIMVCYISIRINKYSSCCSISSIEKKIVMTVWRLPTEIPLINVVSTRTLRLSKVSNPWLGTPWSFDKCIILVPDCLYVSIASKKIFFLEILESVQQQLHSLCFKSPWN